MIENTFSDLLHRCAQFLQAECIRRTHMNHVVVSIAEVREWYTPPLMVECQLGDIDLQDLVVALYSDEGTTPAAFLATWDSTMALFKNGATVGRRRLARHCRSVFPSVPFWLPLDVPEQAFLVQYLWAAGWKAGRLVWKGRRMTVEADGKTVGFDHRIVRTTTATAPSRMLSVPSYKPFVTMPLGNRRAALPRASSVYTHLVRCMPDLATAIDIVFAAAVHAGRGWEAVLVAPFDVVNAETPGVRRSRVWDEARRLISTAPRPPHSDLYAILRPVIGHRKYLVEFGNPHRTHDSYTAELRRRHINSLEQLEVIGTVRREDPASRAALDLLQFQNLIGAL